MTDESAAKRQARELMEREFERIGLRYHRHAEDQWELLQERHELEELWALGGFGEPPAFEPTAAAAIKQQRAG
jgi:hypothetical protein